MSRFLRQRRAEVSESLSKHARVEFELTCPICDRIEHGSHAHDQLKAALSGGKADQTRRFPQDAYVIEEPP